MSGGRTDFRNGERDTKRGSPLRESTERRNRKGASRKAKKESGKDVDRDVEDRW